MTGLARVDPGTLGWIRSEIDVTLGQARQHLSESEPHDEDVTPFRLFANDLHQVVGTLQMMEIDGAATLAQEVEALADALVNGNVPAEPEPMRLLNHGLGALSDYLNNLHKGLPDLPIKQIDILNQLRSARGEAPLQTYDLFRPDLDTVPPAHNKGRLDDEEYKQTAHNLRHEFQKHLLSWLSNGAEAGPLEGLGSTVDALHTIARFGRIAQLWWVARAFIDMLAANQTTAQVEHKRLLGRLDQQIRALAQDGESALIRQAPEELVKRMLFEIGSDSATAPRIQEIRDAFDLEILLTGELPVDEEELAALPTNEQLASLHDAVGEDIDAAQELLAAYFRAQQADDAALHSLLDRLRNVLAHAEQTSIKAVQELVDDLIQLAEAIKGGKAVDLEDASLEMAGALLFLNESLKGIHTPDLDWKDEITSKVERLRAIRLAVDVSDLAEGDEDRWSEQALSAAEFKQVMGSVADEIYVNLKRAEEALECYAANREAKEIQPVPEYFKQVQGVLQILGQHHIAELLGMASDSCQQLVDGALKPEKSLIEALAVTVGATEAYVQGLEESRPKQTDLVGRAIQDLEVAVANRDLDQIDLNAVVDEIRDCLRRWLADNADYESLRLLHRNLRLISSLADQRDHPMLYQIAVEMNNLLDIVTNDPALLTDEVYDTLHRSLDRLMALAGKLSAATPAGESPPTVGSEQSAVEDTNLRLDILEIFSEEAEECIQTIDNSLVAWKQDRNDTQALTDLRRQFHTLKGSGRMAGAGQPAELAWIVEDLLNHVIDGKLEGSDHVLEFTEHATGGLKPILKNKLEGAGRIDLDWWRTRSHQILTGQAEPQAVEQEEQQPAAEETVFTIFTKETLQHLSVIRGCLGACKKSVDNCGIGDELLRSLHTLSGSSRSLGLTDMSDACKAVDATLQTLRAADGRLRASEMELLDKLAISCSKSLDQLNRGDQPSDALRSDFQRLVERSQSLRQSYREPRSGPPEQAAESPAEPVLSVVEQSQPEPTEAMASDLLADTASLESLVPADVRSELAGAADATEAGAQAALDFRDIFCEEALDLLARINLQLSLWAEDGYNSNINAALKRDLHTLKGSARAAGADAIGDLSHNTETLLERIEKLSDVDRRGLRGLLEEVHDTLGNMVHRMEHHQSLPSAVTLNQTVLDFAEPRPKPPDFAPQAAPESVDEAAAAATTMREAFDQDADVAADMTVEGLQPEAVAAAASTDTDTLRREHVRVQATALNDLFNYAGEVSISRAQLEEQLNGLTTNLNELRANVVRFSEQLRDLEIQADTQIHSTVEDKEKSGFEEEFDPLEFDRYTKLQHLSRSLSESLDDLMTIEAGLNRFASAAESVLRQQGHLSSELQDGLMRTRMVPFSTLIPRLRHHARQTARELGKQAELQIEGRDVEIDRNVLETMTEAFEHMIRNAVDHGIEFSEQRVRAGKPETGTVRIECTQEGNEIVIRFNDDGAGLDVEKIHRKALREGLLKQHTSLTDQELIQLIVTPGFSTAETVTQLSGRGVGLDVVHSAVRRLGGNISVENGSGAGTTFIVRLPVTLSITHALFVRCAAQSFAVPLGVIHRVLKIDRDQLPEETGGEALLHTAGQDYPLMNLADRLRLAPDADPAPRVPILVVRMGARDIAVQVDEVTGTQEVVVKTVGGHLDSIQGIAGATVRGDGSVVLILDLAELWVAHEATPQLPRDAEEVDSAGAPLIMVVDDSLTVRKITSRNLSRHGMQVAMAKDGVDALEQIRVHRPDLLLVDIEMPRMDGYELTSRIRSMATTRDIPIVIITSRAGSKHQQKAMELGANAYLSKPYREEELVANIEALLPQFFGSGQQIMH